MLPSDLGERGSPVIAKELLSKLANNIDTGNFLQPMIRKLGGFFQGKEMVSMNLVLPHSAQFHRAQLFSFLFSLSLRENEWNKDNY